MKLSVNYYFSFYNNSLLQRTFNLSQICFFLGFNTVSIMKTTNPIKILKRKLDDIFKLYWSAQEQSLHWNLLQQWCVPVVPKQPSHMIGCLHTLDLYLEFSIASVILLERWPVVDLVVVDVVVVVDVIVVVVVMVEVVVVDVEDVKVVVVVVDVVVVVVIDVVDVSVVDCEPDSSDSLDLCSELSPYRSSRE